MGYCPEQDKLSSQAMEILSQIARTSQEQVTALKRGDQTVLMNLDKELERMVGEKERVFGALKQHRHEHGC
jgi:hypothetical protein